jgi:hypothetical protein
MWSSYEIQMKVVGKMIEDWRDMEARTSHRRWIGPLIRLSKIPILLLCYLGLLISALCMPLLFFQAICWITRPPQLSYWISGGALLAVVVLLVVRCLTVTRLWSLHVDTLTMFFGFLLSAMAIADILPRGW